MRFGDYLLQQQFTPWATEYLQYDRIKKVIRETHDETIIAQWLDTEFIKIKDFLSRQISTIQYQLQLIEHQKTQPALISSQDQLGDDLAYPLFDLHDLVRYLDLCLAGFKKLAKSYTKRHPLQISSTAIHPHDGIIKALDHYYTPLNQLLVHMAHIKKKCSRETQKRQSIMKDLPSIPRTTSSRSRDLDAPLPPLPLQNEDGDRVIISSYWIHPHHVFELKTLLLIYATLDHHHPLSTIYFDNSQWSVYSSHMNEQTLPTDSIECTWPGFYHAPNGNIQVNHIGHHEHDVISIKQHALPWTLFQSYLRPASQSPAKDKVGGHVSTGNEACTSDGDLAMATALVVEPKSKVNADEQQLGQVIRDRIQQQEWQPVATWTCERTTFTTTNGGDNNNDSIKVHIDTNIVIKELDGSFGGQQQSGGTRHRHTGLSMMTVVQQLKTPGNTKKTRWQQHDDNSLGRRTPADILTNRSPASKQQERPEWLKHLLDRCNWIHAVPRFSMYVHLVSKLYGDHVPLLPWWLGYFDRSWLDSAIRQNNSSYGLSRSIGLQPLLHGAPVSTLLTHPIGNDNMVVVEPTRNQHISVDMGTGGNEEEGDDDDDLDDGTGKERDAKMLLPKSATPNIVPTTTTTRAKTTTPSISVPAMTTSAKSAINNMVKKTTKRMAKARWTATTTTTKATTSTRAMTTMKMKVEPKVFFANERTFLSWLQFCALLLTVSLNMINFGSQDDSISRICGGMFIIVTILMALYALAKYEFRAWNLLTRSSRYRFDDVYGPAILCTLLVVAMLVNFGLRLNSPPSPGRQSASE